MAIDLTDYSRTPAQRGWGPGWPSCGGALGRTVVVTADRSGTRITVHERIARLVDLLIDWTENPAGGNYMLKPGECGGFNCRPIANTNSPSLHSWGLAIDANWGSNPLTTTGKHDIPTFVARRWNRYGFAWGGDYQGAAKDWMHLEQMGTPAEVDAVTALAIQELGNPAAVPPAPRRPDQEDAAVYLDTEAPRNWSDKKSWPTRRVSFGFDPVGGWGGKVVVKGHWGAPGGWIQEAKWWVRGGSGVGAANKPHSPVAIDTAPIAERFVGFGLELTPPDRADELEIVLSAPGGLHLFTTYER